MSRTLSIVLVLAALAVFATWAFVAYDPTKRERDTATQRDLTSTDADSITVIAEGLTIPWGIAFLPDGSLLVTERSGNIMHITNPSAGDPSAAAVGRTYHIDDVAHVGEGGLLGIALHPDFTETRYVYLYQTTRSNNGLQNRVVRYVYENETLVFDQTIVDGLPGASYHDGGRIAFGPDGFLYITVGDAGMPSSAQDRATYAGTILRVTADGSIPADNPFGDAIYSYGHRNPQGLAWDREGRLWSTEHGRSGVRSGFDEINLIEAGANYGWPDSQGDTVLEDTVAPVRHSTAAVTWAPASAAYLDGRLYFGGLRGETLYEAVLSGTEVVELREHFVGEYGRIRTVAVGPDGFLYLTTSNRDGRGNPIPSDDRVIRVDPSVFTDE